MHAAARRTAGIALSALLLVPPAASAFEFYDGRVQVHGFYEAQLRTIARDFDADDGWDLTQWYNVLNIEVEADIAPDGWGPFGLISGFARVEGRFDCVWTRACGLFSSADAYGNRAERLPKRVSDGRRAGYYSSGALFNGDRRFFRNLPRGMLGFEYSQTTRADFFNSDTGQTETLRVQRRSRKPYAPSFPGLLNSGKKWHSGFFDIEGIDTLFDTAGPDAIFDTADDPAPFIFDSARNCTFGFRDERGSEAGRGHQVLPWNPKCNIRPQRRLADKPNPLNPADENAVVLGPGNGGFGVLPLRPVPENLATDSGAPRHEARGIFMPNAGLSHMIRKGEFGDFDQNYSQAQLQWNRGASQTDEGELKELYLDLELFDSRLWIRGGKQTIVWGKTELFRTTDQFNPQDLALASLPSLEESRIALWALRGVWSFYDVGPLEDLRLEVAVNYDEFEPNDLGRCGEPYSPLPVCDKTFGLFIHGFTGLGLAGEVRPEDPWDDLSGLEVGARVEFRWDRFSFALVDFWGYDDLAYQDTVFTYSRNVDPFTGRARHTNAAGPCANPDLDPDCLLGIDPTTGNLIGGAGLTQKQQKDALRFHPANQQLFAMICATSVGLQPSLDATACGQTVFNSQINLLTLDNPQPITRPGVEGSIAALASNLLVGNPFAEVLAQFNLTGGVAIPHVTLNQDPCDGFLADCTTLGPLPNVFFSQGDLGAGTPGSLPTMNNLLTVYQQALLGCGAFFFTDCEIDGIDLMNTEASVVMQSWPGFEGAGGTNGWDTRNAAIAQPGTEGFQGGPVATRYQDGRLLILPGARGPGYQNADSPYDPLIDGCRSAADDPLCATSNGGMGARDLRHPFTNQLFRTEMATLSFNALTALVALSSPEDPANPTIAEFSAAAPFRTDGCSFATPYFCANVQSFFQITGVQRNTVKAGGNSSFGRRDFVWHGGTPLVLRYEKRNVLGLSMDWAEDVTKSNWGFEFTWIEDLPFTNLDSRDRLSDADTFNLTISVDRPTFINFLNPNRTFFFNSQIFLQYVDGYQKGFTSNGPWNMLATFTVQTGFFRDRFNPSMTFVYDVRSSSGAWLPSLQYRYTENFSVTFGLASFFGHTQERRMGLSPTSLHNRTGERAYRDFVDNGLSVVRERDEVFLRVRYTF